MADESIVQIVDVEIDFSSDGSAVISGTCVGCGEEVDAIFGGEPAICSCGISWSAGAELVGIRRH